MVYDELARQLSRLAERGNLSREARTRLWQTTDRDPAGRAISSLGVDLRLRFSERFEWFRKACHLSPRTSVTVSGRREEALMSLTELWRFYLPLSQALFQMAQREDCVRVSAGVTGPPGSGKSVFSALMDKVINVCLTDHEIHAATCSLDGFHFSNNYLDSHSVSEGGERVALRTRKGAPDTFDVDGFLQALDRLNSDPTVLMPRYDRRLHDPVPDAIEIEHSDRIVLVEGNYLLLEEGRWADVASRLNPCLFLDISLEAVKPRMIERHMRGGRDRADAARHFDRVDRANFEKVMANANRADLVISRNKNQRIEAVHRP